MRARYVETVLGLKGIIAIASLMVIVAALVSYTATVTITVSKPYSLGASAQNWTINENDQNMIRYLPGEVDTNATLTFDQGSSSTWAFKVVTDTNRGMAVRIELEDYTKTVNFTKFEITVLWRNTTTSWQEAQLYGGQTASAGQKTPNLINGTLNGDFGYIHQLRAASGTLTRCYLIKVTYTYPSSATGPTVKFVYTPTPEDTL